ncbi:hypothetical protein AHAS_Ahas13G0219600 [Arachis hypogaea]
MEVMTVATRNTIITLWFIERNIEIMGDFPNDRMIRNPVILILRSHNLTKGVHESGTRSQSANGVTVEGVELMPKKTIIIGVFIGYSLLHTALTIPQDGKIIALDPDREAYDKDSHP